jgi:hypothetical protein
MNIAALWMSVPAISMNKSPRRQSKYQTERNRGERRPEMKNMKHLSMIAILTAAACLLPACYGPGYVYTRPGYQTAGEPSRHTTVRQRESHTYFRETPVYTSAPRSTVIIRRTIQPAIYVRESHARTPAPRPYRTYVNNGPTVKIRKFNSKSDKRPRRSGNATRTPVKTTHYGFLPVSSTRDFVRTVKKPRPNPANNRGNRPQSIDKRIKIKVHINNKPANSPGSIKKKSKNRPASNGKKPDAGKGPFKKEKSPFRQNGKKEHGQPGSSGQGNSPNRFSTPRGHTPGRIKTGQPKSGHSNSGKRPETRPGKSADHPNFPPTANRPERPVNSPGNSSYRPSSNGFTGAKNPGNRPNFNRDWKEKNRNHPAENEHEKGDDKIKRKEEKNRKQPKGKAKK